MRHQD